MELYSFSLDDIQDNEAGEPTFWKIYIVAFQMFARKDVCENLSKKMHSEYTENSQISKNCVLQTHVYRKYTYYPFLGKATGEPHIAHPVQSLHQIRHDQHSLPNIPLLS